MPLCGAQRSHLQGSEQLVASGGGSAYVSKLQCTVASRCCRTPEAGQTSGPEIGYASGLVQTQTGRLRHPHKTSSGSRARDRWHVDECRCSARWVGARSGWGLCDARREVIFMLAGVWRMRGPCGRTVHSEMEGRVRQPAVYAGAPQSTLLRLLNYVRLLLR
jgi:hypothetical protein